MTLKQEVIDNYIEVCESLNKSLARDDYREYGLYKTSLIDKLFGSWTNFIKEISDQSLFGRGEEKVIKTDAENIIITSIIDGQNINEEFFNTLKYYANKNNGKLYILWSKAITKYKHFDKKLYNKLLPHLATKIDFELDSKCTAQDTLLNYACKNPLVNLEKIHDYNTFIVASPHQYMKILPYDYNNNSYRVAWSTGTLSLIDYPKNINGQLNSLNHTFGAVLLTYDKQLKKYITRNLIFNGKSLYDIDKIYTSNKITETTAESIILGDLHLPEEDDFAVTQSINLINRCVPKSVLLHDWCSFNSINHHESNKALTKILNTTEFNKTLEDELVESSKRLNNIISKCIDTEFYIVHSNHDDFIIKWLDEGEFIKDRFNALTGCKMFNSVLNNNNPFEPYINNNKVHYLKENDTFVIKDIQLASHGSTGISGSKGNPKSYTKLYNKSVTAHTHSPQIFEGNYVVGTNSKIKLGYTSKFTTWAFCNAIVHKNGEIQLIFSN